MWASLLRNWKGLCARIMIKSEITIIKRSEKEMRGTRCKCKLKYKQDPNVYLDSIG